MDKKRLLRKAQSYYQERPRKASMSWMMNDDPESVESEMSESQAKSFKELNCLIMNSVSYIKTLAEADLKQVEEKKIILPLIENNKSRIFVHPLICGLYLSQLYRENYNLRFGRNTDSQSNSS